LYGLEPIESIPEFKFSNPISNDLKKQITAACFSDVHTIPFQLKTSLFKPLGRTCRESTWEKQTHSFFFFFSQRKHCVTTAR
jgi:hypothetical protein